MALDEWGHSRMGALAKWGHSQIWALAEWGHSQMGAFSLLFTSAPCAHQTKKERLQEVYVCGGEAGQQLLLVYMWCNREAASHDT